MHEKILVIGAGPGGYVAALRAAALGADVTIIEKEHVGGTCLNQGCIPSKILKTSADLFLSFQDAGKFGIVPGMAPTFDMTALMQRKQKIIEIQRQGIAALLKKSRVRFEQGRGMIKQNGLAALVAEDGNEKDIPFDKLIIATGTIPFNIPAFPFDGEKILSSDDLLELKDIPKSILIVGGGVIGCEFAFILSALGTEVTIVEAMPRLLPLPSVDESCSKILGREMKKKKMKFITDRVVMKAELDEDMLKVTIAASPFLDKEKQLKIKPKCIEIEKMAVCIGRSPLTGDIGLENIGLKTDEKGWIKVNDKMETEIPGVYAIGDILGPSKVMLAHVASHEGMVAAENAIGRNRKMHYNAVPGAIFTSPEIGDVGITESEAGKQGLDVICSSVNFRNLGKAQAMGEIAGEAKIVADTKSGKVLGVHIIGPHATDLIAEGALAVTKGLLISDIAKTIHAHPTLAEIMSEASLKGVDMYNHK